MGIRDWLRGLTVLAIAILGWGLDRTTFAGENAALACGCEETCCCVRRSEVNGWQTDESRNFRFHHVGQAALTTNLVRLCEVSRKRLGERWLGDTAKADWSPKCEVYLYPTVDAYRRFTRYAADSWGYADIEIGSGKVWMRRLDLRADNEERLSAVAVHELTHVVLANRFATQRIPRWADEGIALLSEPEKRRNDLREWLKTESQLGRCWSLKTLTGMPEYPHDKRSADLFYAQSGSFVEYLLGQRGQTEPEVLQFVEQVRKDGLSKAVEMTWPETSVAQLEAEWRGWLRRDETTKTLAKVSTQRLSSKPR